MHNEHSRELRRGRGVTAAAPTMRIGGEEKVESKDGMWAPLR
jgi:hypothetical protein